MNIGFIGLGIMGRPMAKNLIKAGYSLTVYDKFASCDEFVALGAKVGASNKDVAAQSDVIITMLPNSPHVKYERANSIALPEQTARRLR